MGRSESWLWSLRERQCLSLLQTRFHCIGSLLQIHAFMLRNALDTNINLITKLIASLTSTDPRYGTRHARQIFDQMPQRSDIFFCNTMMKSHLSSGQFSEAVGLYVHLRRWERFDPDNYTFSTVAKCCGLDHLTWEGMGLHGHVVRYGFLSNLYVATALVDMYGKLGKMDFAREVFDKMVERSSVSWTALINGYIRCGDIGIARSYFDLMPVSEKDSATFNVMIDGYVKLGDMQSAKMLFHTSVEKNVVTWTTILDGYCGCGDLEEARFLFDIMPIRNLYSWNVMIGGYSRNKQPHKAIALFQELLASKCFNPDDVTVVSVLPAIADVGAVDLGNWVFEFVVRNNLDTYVNVSTSLVDMFAKCGEIEKGRRVFDLVKVKSTCTWNALINGLAINGRALEALNVFQEMKTKGFKPNEITMLGVLSACNHGGLVEEGKLWFSKMVELNITPKIEHYGCLVDLLGRAGCLEEAERLIQSMPYESNGIILSSLLFACGSSNDVARAEKIAKEAVKMEPCNDGNYVMLRNLYACDRRWRDVEHIKRLMKVKGTRKETGFSTIETNNEVIEFIAGDNKHPHVEMTQMLMDHLLIHMKSEDPFLEQLTN